jgi:hypothetical protein
MICLVFFAFGCKDLAGPQGPLESLFLNDQAAEITSSTEEGWVEPSECGEWQGQSRRIVRRDLFSEKG